MNGAKNRKNRAGAALLLVLFIVMAITVLSFGYIARSDMELACGANTLLRTQMDCLAESGLVHAKGLILNPQDVDSGGSGYWAGAEGQQLTGGEDYYDVSVVELGPCNYRITSTAYRQNGGEIIGQSELAAELRLDPCIAYWAGATTTIPAVVTINGDVYCNATLENFGVIRGDVFAAGLTGSIDGQLYQKEQLSVGWPAVEVSDFSSQYYIESSGYSVQGIDPNISNTSFGPSGVNPGGVHYCNGDMRLAGSVVINGTLAVNGNMTVSGPNNRIIAQKNFPALLVEGEVVIEDGGGLSVEGLALVKQRMVIDANSSNVDVDVAGGLFIKNGAIDAEGSGSGYINITAAPGKAALGLWASPGDAARWRQAGDAFFKSISRN